MNPPITMQGIAPKPTKPNLHSKAKANIIPRIIVDEVESNVDIREVIRPLTFSESVPKRVAAAPPRF